MMRRMVSSMGIVLLYAGLLAASPADYFKQSPVLHATGMEFHNPAALTTPVRNGAWYRYGLDNITGSIHHPFSAASATYHTFTAAGHKTLNNNTLFAGTFSYRENREYDRFFRHNSTLNGLIPVYLADSTAGDWHLSGIQWTLDVQKPFSEKVSGGVSLYYMVDEQVKQNFPKPGVKRNGYEVTSGFLYHSGQNKISLSASLFEFKEEIETVKYSLEQNLTPVFMLFRGFDDPVYYRGQTSYDRLQTRQGFSVSAGLSSTLLPGSLLKGEITAEWSRGDAEDEGTDAIPQGSWTTRRLIWETTAKLAHNRFFSPVLLLNGNMVTSEATHPDFPLTLYQGTMAEFSAFAGLAAGDQNCLTAGVAFEGFQSWREDTFHGRGLQGEKFMAGPELRVEMEQKANMTSQFYGAALREISSISRLRQSHYQTTDVAPTLVEDELWAMTAGNTRLKSGAIICLNGLSRFTACLDFSYNWLADIHENRSVNARREQLMIKLTLTPKHE